MPSFFVSLFKFFTIAFVVLQISGPAHCDIRCGSLFKNQNNSVLQLALPLNPYAAYDAIQSLLSLQANGISLNLSSSIAKLKAAVAHLPPEVRAERGRELQIARQSIIKLNVYDSSFVDRIWLVQFAVDPTSAIQQFKKEVLSKNSAATLLQLIGEFVRLYDVEIARQLAVELIRDFSNARKTERWKNWWEPIEFKTQQDLQPKRSISFLIKILMGYPALLKSERTPTNGLRIATFEKYIESVTSLFKSANVRFEPPTSKQIVMMIGVLQKYLQNWSQANPAQKASIVVKGSFVNGLAIGYKVDIDILIVNSELFDNLWNQNRTSLQNQIEKALQASGPRLPTIWIDPGNPDAKERARYLSDRTARENGFINTLSFEVFSDRVEILIHDPTKAPPGRPSFEAFLAE